MTTEQHISEAVTARGSGTAAGIVGRRDLSWAGKAAALQSITAALARGAGPETLPQSVLTEIANAFAADYVAVVRYTTTDTAQVVVDHFHRQESTSLQGRSVSLAGECVTAGVQRTGAPARIADYPATRGSVAPQLWRHGIRSSAGAPVTVADYLWGAVVLGSRRRSSLPPGTADSLSVFANLLATALLHQRTHAALHASRARVIEAADTARRRLERDLHDGAQQRLVSVGLQLQMMQASLPPGAGELRSQLAEAANNLTDLHADLQRLARGLHPGILSTGGLTAALRALARRSTIPVTLKLGTLDHALQVPVSVAAYYVVAEALTNTAKHAQAAHITVETKVQDGTLTVSVTDDGTGGAQMNTGSGLLGLTDRVEALGGHLRVISAADAGTAVHARIPLVAPPRGVNPTPPLQPTLWTRKDSGRHS